MRAWSIPSAEQIRLAAGMEGLGEKGASPFFPLLLHGKYHLPCVRILFFRSIYLLTKNNSAMQPLPLSYEFETKKILKKLSQAHRALAELKGVAETVPNQDIIVNTLSLQEAKDSSAIENIVTTHDDLYKSDVASRHFTTHEAKEVYNYKDALWLGYEKVKKSGVLTNNIILAVQAVLEENEAGFRKLPGTELKNDRTGEVVYTPPQDGNEVARLMDNLEKFINNDSLSEDDPLTKMAIIHHQFESIHPFYDGNGRTGRIINVLYLVKHRLLDSPVLYLSRFINKNKGEYYRLLQAVRDQSAWEDWILYLLEGIIQTSIETIDLIRGIRNLMLEYKSTIRKETNIYSLELLNVLFRHPYTKNEFLTNELKIHRNTASKYLEELVRIGLLRKHKIKKENYYINQPLYEFFFKC